MEPMIRVEDLHFSYPLNQKQTIEVLKGISFSVYPGEYVAIIGPNGSGKSTLSKLLNGLLLPTSGDVWVKGRNTKDKKNVREIRKTIGMVFQHPDNQIVATIVEEDVAFGLENLAVPREEMKKRVDEALDAVGMTEHRLRPPHHLSGGQKQRVAIAGVLAMAPECIIFDEATSMLDRIGQQEVLEVMRRLHREGMTLLTVTHRMEEAAEADRILLMDRGKIIMDAPPTQVFQQEELLERFGIEAPSAFRLSEMVHREKPIFPRHLRTTDEVILEVERLLKVFEGS